MIGSRRTVTAFVLFAAYVTVLALVDHEPRSRAASVVSLDEAAAQYVRLALELDRVRPGEVDSYFGPAVLRPSPGMRPEDLARLAARAHALEDEITRIEAGDATRRTRLAKYVAVLAEALDAQVTPSRVALLEQARNLYGIAVSTPAGAEVEAARRSLNRLLPGNGALASRVRNLRAALLVPTERRTAVFDRALTACRDATAAHWPLPRAESLEVVWDASTGAAWHRYEGRGRSRLLVNPAAVATIDTALDVACHEGYPGHHAQFALLDAGERVVLEEQVVLLSSPSSVAREGAAQYGVDLAMPPAARLRVEREVLAPLAGIDDPAVLRHHEARPHLRVLEGLVPGILGAWHDGLISDHEAAQRLEDEALIPSPVALLRFTREYGAYVLAYTAARQGVAELVAERRRVSGQTEWTTLRALVAPPRAEWLRTADRR